MAPVVVCRMLLIVAGLLASTSFGANVLLVTLSSSAGTSMTRALSAIPSAFIFSEPYPQQHELPVDEPAPDPSADMAETVNEEDQAEEIQIAVEAMLTSSTTTPPTRSLQTRRHRHKSGDDPTSQLATDAAQEGNAQLPEPLPPSDETRPGRRRNILQLMASDQVPFVVRVEDSEEEAEGAHLEELDTNAEKQLVVIPEPLTTRGTTTTTTPPVLPSYAALFLCDVFADNTTARAVMTPANCLLNSDLIGSQAAIARCTAGQLTSEDIDVLYEACRSADVRVVFTSQFDRHNDFTGLSSDDLPKVVYVARHPLATFVSQYIFDAVPAPLDANGKDNLYHVASSSCKRMTRTHAVLTERLTALGLDVLLVVFENFKTSGNFYVQSLLKLIGVGSNPTLVNAMTARLLTPSSISAGAGVGQQSPSYEESRRRTEVLTREFNRDNFRTMFFAIIECEKALQIFHSQHVD